MNTRTIISIILVTLGIVVLAYSGLSFNMPGEPIDFWGMHFETTTSHYISPAVGMLALIGGTVLFMTKTKTV